MNSKAGRLIDEYDRSGLGDQLIDAWTGEGDDHQSLRELADHFNRELLRAAMAEAGMTTLEGEVANTYRLLTAEDVSTGVRTQAETTLDRNGIDPQQLQQDFVSHQAIHTYPTEHRGVEHPTERTKPDRIETADNTIQRLGSCLVVAEKRLGSPVGLRDNHARHVQRSY